MAVDASDKKRLLDEYNKSFKTPVKKLKVDEDDKKDNIKSSMANKPILKIKIKKPFQKELPLVEKSVEEVEEKRLQTPLKMDTNKCSRELAYKKVYVRRVKNKEGLKEVESKAKEFKPKKKEEELKAISMKIARCNKDQESGRKMLISLPSQMKDFESKNKKFESRENKLEPKEKQCERQLKEHELKEKHYKKQVKKLKSRKKELKGQVKEYESREEISQGHVKEFESQIKYFEERVKVLESREKELKGQVKEYESREEISQGQVKEFESQIMYFEERVKMLESREKELKGQVKVFESMEEESQGQLLMITYGEEKESDNQLSPSIDGRSSQFLQSDQADELEFLVDDILVSLRESPDPSKDVLDLILDPIIPRSRDRDGAVVIEGGHIIFLEQLMKISPNVNYHVREEALKLALNLKANMSENTENSLVVLAFLLLVAIYGLLPYFDKDEVYKFLGFAAHHKVAVELFRTLGFAYKISDFIQNLIGKQQYIVAVRFIIAYNLVDKHQLVDLS